MKSPNDILNEIKNLEDSLNKSHEKLYDSLIDYIQNKKLSVSNSISFFNEYYERSNDETKKFILFACMLDVATQNEYVQLFSNETVLNLVIDLYNNVLNTSNPPTAKDAELDNFISSYKQILQTKLLELNDEKFFKVISIIRSVNIEALDALKNYSFDGNEITKRISKRNKVYNNRTLPDFARHGNDGVLYLDFGLCASVISLKGMNQTILHYIETSDKPFQLRYHRTLLELDVNRDENFVFSFELRDSKSVHELKDSKSVYLNTSKELTSNILDQYLTKDGFDNKEIILDELYQSFVFDDGGRISKEINDFDTWYNKNVLGNDCRKLVAKVHEYIKQGYFIDDIDNVQDTLNPQFQAAKYIAEVFEKALEEFFDDIYNMLLKYKLVFIDDCDRQDYVKVVKNNWEALKKIDVDDQE